MERKYLILGIIIFVAIAGYLAYSYFKPTKPDATCNGAVKEESISCQSVCGGGCIVKHYVCAENIGCNFDGKTETATGTFSCYSWDGNYNKIEIYCK